MITAPEEELQNLETIRNQITLSEGELLRLRNLRVSEEYEITQLVNKRRFYEDEITQLEDNKKTLTEDIQSLQTTLDEAKSIIANASKVQSDQQLEWDKLAIAKKDHQTQKDSELTDIQSKHDDLKSKQTQHEVNVVALHGRDVALKIKENKLKDFVASLGT